ncbi:DUF1444 domain-containing protein [Evansella cellulosilytica]|uniref:DUF1444 domain-containing protein n=1 Tax=Evansella cellulosilytica (strain ATCC 21833 / DSM 2522 / FERM P-1141 / JCM 9156 / N-4) TaxID=649639 RepID=E6U181_EVAC2|nr:DUF1444 domain-containing protein [Evansella cellulosilytica]ADU31527.1 protein of unknown function DUF1444 [Evansella cellulosilytica DSM 2522]
MRPIEIKREIESHLNNENWTTSYDKDAEALRVIDKRYNKGVTIQLSSLKDKFKADKEKTLAYVLHNINEGLSLLTAETIIDGNEKNIFPVIRSASFNIELEDGRKLISTPHTAETKILYALDRGNSYTLIDEDALKRSRKTMEEIEEIALFNVRSLNVEVKEDVVAGNHFYFVHTDDAYDASRILNESLLKEFAKKIDGDFGIAVPHQDVLILADLKNETGYDVLAQMVFQFFSEGRVPITALPFLYEDGNLEPIFILAQKKPKESKKDK